MSTPESKPVRARDVQPYIWGVWCSVGGGEPFVNTVMDVRWSEDGSKIVLSLESHSFDFLDPDKEIELVPIPPMPHRANYPPFVPPPRPVKTTCARCGHVTVERFEEDPFGGHSKQATRPAGDGETK